MALAMDVRLSVCLYVRFLVFNHCWSSICGCQMISLPSAVTIDVSYYQFLQKFTNKYSNYDYEANLGQLKHHNIHIYVVKIIVEIVNIVNIQS